MYPVEIVTDNGAGEMWHPSIGAQLEKLNQLVIESVDTKQSQDTKLETLSSSNRIPHLDGAKL